LGVYRQWKRWCRFPRYFFDDPQMPGLAERFAQVNTPMVALNSLDDLWAPPASRDAFMAAYGNAPYQARTLDSQAEGLGDIGHMGYFRPAAQRLWDETLDWFELRMAERVAA
jgi:predicted alpha/beta hydrolase